MYARDHPLCALYVLVAACVRITTANALHGLCSALAPSASFKRALVEWPHADTWIAHGVPSSFTSSACHAMFKSLKHFHAIEWTYADIDYAVHAVIVRLFYIARAAKRDRRVPGARRIVRNWMPCALWRAIRVPAESASGSPLDHLIRTHTHRRKCNRRPVRMKKAFLRRLFAMAVAYDGQLTFGKNVCRVVLCASRMPIAHLKEVAALEAACSFVPDEVSYACSGELYSV